MSTTNQKHLRAWGKVKAMSPTADGIRVRLEPVEVPISGAASSGIMSGTAPGDYLTAKLGAPVELTFDDPKAREFFKEGGQYEVNILQT